MGADLLARARRRPFRRRSDRRRRPAAPARGCRAPAAGRERVRRARGPRRRGRRPPSASCSSRTRPAPAAQGRGTRRAPVQQPRQLRRLLGARGLSTRLLGGGGFLGVRRLGLDLLDVAPRSSTSRPLRPLRRQRPRHRSSAAAPLPLASPAGCRRLLLRGLLLRGGVDLLGDLVERGLDGLGLRGQLGHVGRSRGRSRAPRSRR